MDYERFPCRWVRRYAWFPVRMTHGYWVWLTPYWEMQEFEPDEVFGRWHPIYKHDNS
jgi:hypothetical protein